MEGLSIKRTRTARQQKLSQQKIFNLEKEGYSAGFEPLILGRLKFERYPGEDLGGGGGDTSSQGFDPLPNQRAPFFTILRYLFLVTDPNIFLRASSAPKCTDFEGGARLKKTQFFGQNYPKDA